ncbi:hypothetical protein AUP43_07545 [Oceanibaculum pacificum]|uniref:ABC transporter domain-containing protein n=1 Tax=Oceanibaculum pacificum TaxID=580166 RepID=A0A154W780_9PROT|nr:hypothetical protein AUP43_07545 [Oceanibaculum pacificum]
MIEIAGLECRRGDSFRLIVARFVARPGERLAIVGPSGSGKSTFLDIVALTLAAQKMGATEKPGHFRFSGMDIGSLNDAALAELRGRDIGYVLQTGGLLGFLSGRENARLPLRRLGRPLEAADRLLERLGVADVAGRKPAALSIGQRQRIAIARALAHRPKIVLADEPTASLDPDSAGRAMDLLVEMAAEQECCVLLVTHDAALAARAGFEAVACRVGGGAGAAVGLIERG